MKTKNLLIAVSIAIFSAFYGFSQNVGINETGDEPEKSAILDVESSNKGVLIPRVELSALNSNSPIGNAVVNSLLVYNTTTAGSGANKVTPGYYYWNNGNWVRLKAEDGKDWRLDGNDISSGEYIGTNNNQNLVVKTNGTNAMIVTTDGKIRAGGASSSYSGTAGSPTYSFESASNTGMYRASGTLNWSLGGTERLRLGTNYLRTTFNGTASVPAYSFTSTNNTSTGMFLPATRSLGFTTNGTERMRIASNGNVGIGTTNPSQKLHVDGNLRLQGALMPNNQAGSVNQFLLSNGNGNAPNWSNFTVLNSQAITSIGKFYSTLSWNGTWSNNTTRTFTILDPDAVCGTTPSGASISFDCSLTSTFRENIIVRNVTVINGELKITVENKAGNLIGEIPITIVAFY